LNNKEDDQTIQTGHHM